jgi:RimJ/RimL family protein N-acetyltransferase
MCSISVAQAITTDRLRLRPPRPADAPRITKYAADFDVARMLSRMPHPYTLAHAEEWLNSLGDPTSRNLGVFAIDVECEGFAGLIAFFVNEEGKTEIGYWMGKPFWGRGYATEALRACLKWAKANLGLKVCHAGHFIDNPASAAVLIKSGFLYTGDVKPTPCASRGADVPMRRMVWLA